MMRRYAGLLVFASAVLPACPFRSRGGGGDNPSEISRQPEVPVAKPPPGAATGHPRLLVRDVDLPRLRSWANSDNPIFESGLKALVDQCVTAMDDGSVFKDDPGSNDGYTASPPEAFAMLFAFYSLVGPEKERAAFAQRAKKLLMHVIDKAAKGAAEGQPYRDPWFSIGDRSRWFGHAFPLTVDWIYPTLSAAEKKTIRTVFLRWANELQHAEKTTYNHPEPVGLVNDPKLLSDVKRVRWASNNYFCAHARNLGFMAMSLDVADDPDEKLRSYLTPVTGAWLYMSDALMRGEMRGGMAAEGFEYSPLSLGYIAQLLLGLYTAGRSDVATFGKQVTFDKNPFWDDVLVGFAHSLSPVAKVPKDQDVAYMGKVYDVAWYGDGEKYWGPDFMGVFGPMGVYDHLTQNAKRLSAIRWIQTHHAPGVEEKLTERAADNNDLLASIFYFMLFDPKAPKAPDPRPSYPLIHFAEGIGRHMQRTSWNENATWFTYKNGWITVDHQSADAGMFELWRKGEWLTKERTGYGDDMACTDYKNMFTIQNDKPRHVAEGEEGYRLAEWKRGSQWTYVNNGDPKILAARAGQDFTYFLGDMTQQYNSKDENAEDVAHASRSLVYLVPDRIVTYDRAASKKARRAKRLWVQLPNRGTVSGDLMTMRTDGGQSFYVRTLLPAKASITVEAAEKLDDDNGKQPALLDPIKYRLRVEDKKQPQSVRWLQVLQGADGKQKPDDAALIDSTSGTSYQGASFNDTVVMFPVDLVAFKSTTYDAPARTKAHLVTGLTPNGGYTVTQRKSGDVVTTTVATGGATKADRGGVLVIGKLP
ncbi:MAG: hypothetical protein KIT84_09650 [Labilithrix sp.]|nr:hypothetical protein [Labilithrix sp.]MCW5811265.1 hypothetical protein [Labilithrix sp.]